MTLDFVTFDLVMDASTNNNPPPATTEQERIAWRQLATLADISRTLLHAPGWARALPRILGLLGENHGMARGFVMLAEANQEEMRVVAGYRLSAAAKSAVVRVGEGVIGQIAADGNARAIPRASREPLLDGPAQVSAATSEEPEWSFFGVPVSLHGKVLGVLGADFFYREGRSYERLSQFLAIVAGMVAQALQAERRAEEEGERLREENSHLQQELRERYDFGHIVGNSSAIRQVYEQVAQVAHSPTTVLLLGESGTGKELIAHAIHYNSARARQPFIKVNCGALPETLLESELFGYEKGAFTGATARKKGRFELADGGTLFLDEIGDISHATQIKLLRVLQEREFERLGGTETIKINVRLVAATNRNLEKAIAAGAFREDLYYRLNVFTIFLPPLRERKSDILLLAEHFLEKYEGAHGKRIRRISTPAIDMLTSYHWPGNVRELENVIERAVLVCDTNVIHGHHLPPSLQTPEGSGTITQMSLADAVAAYERDIIQDALKTTRGNKAKAAQILDTTERILSYKIKTYAIDWQRFKS